MTDPHSSPRSRRQFLGGAAGLATLVGLTAACGGDDGRRPGVGARASTASVGADPELISARYAGLTPFPAPPPAPGTKPVTLNPARPEVFFRVPITDKVVFVTIDDGVEKDPAFVQMVKDFRVPLTLCLADNLIKDDYAYFSRLQETGYVSIQNHTLTHPLSMPRLPAAQQLDEILGQQDKLRVRYGTAPRIFRPPGGNYNATTIDAVRRAGLGGVMLWKESMQIQDMQYQTTAHRLSPGDVILCHFRGPAQLKGHTMVEMMTNLYRSIQTQGYTVADITAYV